MKATVRLNYGAPELLRIEEVSKPIIDNNDVFIKVYATTVNRTDYGILFAKPFIMRFFTGM